MVFLCIRFKFRLVCLIFKRNGFNIVNKHYKLRTNSFKGSSHNLRKSIILFTTKLYCSFPEEYKQQSACASSEVVVLKHLLYINLACLFVCPSVFNKRQNGWTVWAQIFLGISRGRDPSKFDFWKFWKSTKFFYEIREFFRFC